MSAGVMPKLQRQEPWEIIQATAAAADEYSKAVMANNLKRELQDSAEAAANARMERQHVLGLDKTSKELEIKEPYAEKEAARTWGYREKELGVQNENAQRSIQAQGEQNRQTHTSNQRSDFDIQLEYAPKVREVERQKEAEQDERTLRRGAAEGEQKLGFEKRKQEEITDPAAERESARSLKTFGGQTSITYENWKKQRDKLAEEKEAEEAGKPEQIRREGAATTDVLEERTRRTLPYQKELDRAKQETATTRQLTLAQQRALDMAARGEARDQAKLLIEQFRQGKMGERQQAALQAKAAAKGSAELAPGIVLRDLDSPNAILNKKEYSDTSKFKLLYQWTDPVKKHNYEVYQQLGPVGDPRAPNSQFQRPAVPNRATAPEPLGPQPQPPIAAPTPTPVLPTPPQTSAPSQAAPPTTVPNPTLPPPAAGAPTTDWLRPLPPPPSPSPTSGSKGNRSGLDTGSLIQQASLSPANSGITVAPKSGTPERDASGIGQSFDQARRVTEPVTQGGTTTPARRPDGGGQWLRTHAQAPAQYQDAMDRAGQKYNINPDLLAAQTWKESQWKPNARGTSGEIGISQFMPDTARSVGLTNRADPVASIMAQAKLMRQHANTFNGNVGLALAAYNQGAGTDNPNSRSYNRGTKAFIRTGRAPDGTRDYVQKITGISLDRWRDAYLNGTTPTKRTVDDRTETAGSANDLPESAPLPPRRSVGELPATRAPVDDEPSSRTPEQLNIPGTTLRALPFGGGPSRTGTNALIIHHTGDKDAEGNPMRTVSDVKSVLQRGGHGIQYIMDRDGTIHQMAPDDARTSHIRVGQGPGRGLSNSNTIGLEILAKDDTDITPAQVASARNFYKKMGQVYTGLRAYGHGEINPHKQETEGRTVIDAIRGRVKKTENPDLFLVDV